MIKEILKNVLDFKKRSYICASETGILLRYTQKGRWCLSSVGRAKDWKSLCRWFDSSWYHTQRLLNRGLCCLISAPNTTSVSMYLKKWLIHSLKQATKSLPDSVAKPQFLSPVVASRWRLTKGQLVNHHTACDFFVYFVYLWFNKLNKHGILWRIN